MAIPPFDANAVEPLPRAYAPGPLEEAGAPIAIVRKVTPKAGADPGPPVGASRGGAQKNNRARNFFCPLRNHAHIIGAKRD